MTKCHKSSLKTKVHLLVLCELFMNVLFFLFVYSPPHSLSLLCCSFSSFSPSLPLSGAQAINNGSPFISALCCSLVQTILSYFCVVIICTYTFVMRQLASVTMATRQQRWTYSCVIDRNIKLSCAETRGKSRPRILSLICLNGIETGILPFLPY